MKTAILQWITQYGAHWARWLPATAMATLQQRVPLLILRDKQVMVHLWLGDRFDDGQLFAQSDAGRDALTRFLDGAEVGGTAYLLADLMDEELRVETIPQLRGRDRRGLVERRLERMFRRTPYRCATFQGAQAGHTDRVLFSALTAPGLVQPWVDLLRRRSIVIAGVWSTALLSRIVLQQIYPQSTNVLLVSLHDTGQRQTYFHHGHVLVSRLIPQQRTTAEQSVVAIHAEIKRTRLYLNALRLLRPDVSLDVPILCQAELATALQQHPVSTEEVQIRPLLLPELSGRLGLGTVVLGEEEGGVGRLLAQYVLLHAPDNHYAPAEMRRRPLPPWLAGLLGGRQDWSEPQALPTTISQAVATVPMVAPAETPAARPVRRIGEVLLAKGAISQHQLEIAISEQKRLGQPFGKTLITLGFISEEAMRDVLGEALAQETAALDVAMPDATAIQYVPKEFAQRHGVLPLAWQVEQQQLTVAMANTLNMVAIDRLHALLPPGSTVRPLLASESELTAAIDRFYGFDLSVDGILREIETGEVDVESLTGDDGTFHHPMARLTNALITDAVKRGASDIHINPMASFTQVRYRIDGVLLEARILHRKFFSGLSVRIKVMSGMDIAETRAPQDGHFSGMIGNTNIDFRVSAQPTVHGENIVLRILDRSKGLLGLDNLGLTPENRRVLDQVLARPEGIVLVTGPTGSGKTTSLYAMLSTLNARKNNIMTLEDPVEYLLDAILQTPVNKAVDLDFSSGVRSMLRQDPDIILVGEIRDLDTAQMALRAAMTGHKVYSTLHANSAVAAISRLLNIGLSPDMLAGNIIGVLGQRLVRKLCLHCRQPVALGSAERQLLGADEATVATLYAAVGCDVCNGTGYKGRICIMEGVLIDDDFEDLISSNAPQGDYRRLARQKGILTMADFGRRRVLDGSTSVEEFSRIFGVVIAAESVDHA